MLQKNLQQAVNKWKNEGLRLQKPLSAIEVKAALAKSGISAAKEVIEMYAIFNGFAEDGLDSECMTLDRRKSVGGIPKRIAICRVCGLFIRFALVRFQNRR